MSDKPNAIKTMAEYETILDRIHTIFYAKPNTPKGDELKSLLKLTYDYEEGISNDDECQQMSDTPRTDAATYTADCLGKTLVVNRACAAALETELAVSNEEIARLRDLLRFAWADDDTLVVLNQGVRRAYIDAIREELGMDAKIWPAYEPFHTA